MVTLHDWRQRVNVARAAGFGVLLVSPDEYNEINKLASQNRRDRAYTLPDVNNVHGMLFGMPLVVSEPLKTRRAVRPQGTLSKIPLHRSAVISPSVWPKAGTIHTSVKPDGTTQTINPCAGIQPAPLGPGQYRRTT